VLKIKILILLLIIPGLCSARVKVRLFSDLKPESVILTVTNGAYTMNSFNGKQVGLAKGDLVMIMKYNGIIAVKVRNANGFSADSVQFTGIAGNDSFSIRNYGGASIAQYYTGDLLCKTDMGTLMMIDNCDEENYIAGVVRAEGGTGKDPEYFRTQAVLVRTYLYKYSGKHASDGYSLCDGTHCQAFNGLSNDTLINRAVITTKDQVITAGDSTLIISAFHSNCGGETASSEDVWLTPVPYLKSVKDPYCRGSKNATWQKKISSEDWNNALHSAGYTGSISSSGAGFIQNTRQANYRIASFSVPLTSLRNALNLRSTFFSVIPGSDSVTLKGKGYGHGVGLCQEGAMSMAARGFTYRQIIDFYYHGVKILDIKDAHPDPVVSK
jgi:stage II sporulation protein D